MEKAKGLTSDEEVITKTTYLLRGLTVTSVNTMLIVIASIQYVHISHSRQTQLSIVASLTVAAVLLVPKIMDTDGQVFFGLIMMQLLE